MAKIPSFRLKRPFQNAHWLLAVVLVAAWVFAGLVPCKEPPYYFETTLATGSIFLALWLSHLRAFSVSGWHRIVSVAGGALSDLFRLLLLSIVVAIPILITLPAYQCYTPRAKVAEVILAASTFRAEIDARFAQSKMLRDSGIGLVLKPSGRVKAGFVTNDGVIIAIGEDPPAVVLFQPVVTQGQISWRCQGFPTEIMPRSCR